MNTEKLLYLCSFRIKVLNSQMLSRLMLVLQAVLNFSNRTIKYRAF